MRAVSHSLVTNLVVFVGGGMAVFFRDISHYSNGPEEFLWQSFGLHLRVSLYRKPTGPEFDGSCTETTSTEGLGTAVLVTAVFTLAQMNRTHAHSWIGPTQTIPVGTG